MAAKDCVRSALILSALVVAVMGLCRDHEFQCDYNRCLPKRWMCDGDPDCEDGMDEETENCLEANKNPRECDGHEFKCGNAKCIPRNWRCDSHDDCGDGSDEVEEDCLSCREDEFRCVSDGQCVSKEYVCNSMTDCEDGSDEADCVPVTTPASDPDHFYCDNGRRIPYRWKCDGSNDCMDNSDEKHCDNSETGTVPPLCLEGEVQCGLTCILKNWLCDGKADCEGGTDEENCPAHCPQGQFKCINAGCVSEDKRCDGYAHCMDSSDEQDCDVATTTITPRVNSTCDPESQFSCGEEKCIPKQRVCDGINDCTNGEDEEVHVCGIDECREKNGGCEHICVNTRESYYCECKPGYRLHRKFNCEDIDECVEAPGSCSQNCTNTIGGFHCSCLAGYRRDPSNYTRCKADSGDPYLIFSHSYDIRSLRLKDKELTTLVRDTRRATAMDFEYTTNQIIWCDNKDKKIKRAHMSSPEIPEVLVEKDTMIVEGLAVDWIHKNIYYTDIFAKEIRMISWDGVWTRTIVPDELDLPRAIVVNPIDGYIYWTDWGNAPKIERANLDGSDKIPLISAPHVHWPNGITVDYANKKLYWCDGYLNKIKTSNLDGSGIETVLYSSEVLRLPYSVSVFEDRVYWVDWSETALFSADKFNGENIEHVSAGHLLEAPRVVHVFHEYRQPSGDNVCKSHTCSHFCVRSSLGGPLCICPDGFTLSPTDGSTCLNGSAVIISGGSEETIVVDTLPETLVPSAMFSPVSGGGNQEKTVIEVSSPQAGMVLGVVLGSLVVLGLAVGMFVGFIRMRRRVIIHTRFPNPVYRKTTAIEEDGGGYAIEQDGIMFIPQDYDYSDSQDKVLIDHSDSVLLTPKK